MNRVKKTPRQIKLLFCEKLRGLYDEKEALQICQRLFYAFLGWTAAYVQLNNDVILEDRYWTRFEEALKKLMDAVPLQYVIGHTEFMGLELKVAPGVLIPRPETEEMAARIIRESLFERDQVIKVLDIGTGSGCLALAIKNAFRKADVTALDNSQDALEVARKNEGITRLGITFLLFDFLDRAGWDTLPCFDLIISNPPYIPESDRTGMHPSVAENEPPEALYVPDDNPLVFFDAIADFASSHLILPGLVYTEIHERSGEAASALFRNVGFNRVEVIQDFYGKDRFIRAESS
ncbi:MAG: peptide chain release factor N(5)-glutamine methyltransferase [bacterium]